MNVVRLISQRFLENPNVTMKAATGMGQGLFAATALRVGDTVLTETPLFETTVEQDGRVSMDNFEHVLHRVFKAGQGGEHDEEMLGCFEFLTPGKELDPKLTTEIKILAGKYGINPQEAVLVCRKWLGNVFSFGIFLLASKFNHACPANVHYEIGGGRFVATVDIPKGEQLMVTYQDRMWERPNWGIPCSNSTKCSCHSAYDREMLAVINARLTLNVALMMNQGIESPVTVFRKNLKAYRGFDADVKELFKGGHQMDMGNPDTKGSEAVFTVIKAHQANFKALEL